MRRFDFPGLGDQRGGQWVAQRADQCLTGTARRR